jgi:tetratricopeptide (TPR) repeat protein
MRNRFFHAAPQVALGLLLTAGLIGCATGSSLNGGKSFDSGARERAKPFLKDLVSYDFRFSSPKGTCAQMPAESDWKDFVWAAGACVHKQDWMQLEKLGLEMSSRHVDSPWGAYFLGIAAAGRGEFLRSHWMLDLAEKKAGGPLALVRYEKARLLEREEGPASAAKEMIEAVKLDPQMVAGQLWLAQVYHRDRMLNEAERHYRLALDTKGDLYPALSGLSEILVEKKNGPDAVIFLSRALLLKPEVSETRVRLAHVYETMMGEPGKALQTLRELRVAMEKGRSKGRVGFDLNQKILDLEKSMKPVQKEQAQETQPGRQPAQSKKGG